MPDARRSVLKILATIYLLLGTLLAVFIATLFEFGGPAWFFGVVSVLVLVSEGVGLLRGEAIGGGASPWAGERTDAA